MFVSITIWVDCAGTYWLKRGRAPQLCHSLRMPCLRRFVVVVVSGRLNKLANSAASRMEICNRAKGQFDFHNVMRAQH